MPRRAFSRSLIEAVRSSCWVRRKVTRSSSSRYSSSATRFTGPIASSRSSSSVTRTRAPVEIAGGIVLTEQRVGLDAVRAVRLLRELLVPHAALGGLQLDLVNATDEPVELALRRPRLLVERPGLVQPDLMALAGLPGLLLALVALARHVAGGLVRALALGHEPGAALAELRLALARLLDPRREVGLHLVEPRDLAPERLGALRDARELHARLGQSRSQRGLAELRGLDGRAHRRHGRLVARLGVAGRLDVLAEPGQQRLGLHRLAGHLARFGRDRLDVPLHALVLPRRLLEILLARDALGLPRVQRLVDARPGGARSVATSAPSVATVPCSCSTVAVSRSTSTSRSRSWRLRVSSDCGPAAASEPPRRRPVGESTSPAGVTYVATTPLRRHSASARSR